MKTTIKRILNDLKSSLPNLKDPGVLKRFLVIIVLVILSLFAFHKVGSNHITSRYDFNIDSTRVVLVDHTLHQSMVMSENVLDMDVRLKRTVDLICEINGIKYYMLNKIKL